MSGNAIYGVILHWRYARSYPIPEDDGLNPWTSLADTTPTRFSVLAPATRTFLWHTKGGRRGVVPVALPWTLISHPKVWHKDVIQRVVFLDQEPRPGKTVLARGCLLHVVGAGWICCGRGEGADFFSSSFNADLEDVRGLVSKNTIFRLELA